MHKIEISNPKINVINCFDTPPNHLSNNMLSIADSGTNIHPEKQATPTTAPVIMSNKMIERLPDGSTMDSSHISAIHLPGLSKQAR